MILLPVPIGGLHVGDKLTLDYPLTLLQTLALKLRLIRDPRNVVVTAVNTGGYICEVKTQ